MLLAPYYETLLDDAGLGLVQVPKFDKFLELPVVRDFWKKGAVLNPNTWEARICDIADVIFNHADALEVKVAQDILVANGQPPLQTIDDIEEDFFDKATSLVQCRHGPYSPLCSYLFTYPEFLNHAAEDDHPREPKTSPYLATILRKIVAAAELDPDCSVDDLDNARLRIRWTERTGTRQVSLFANWRKLVSLRSHSLFFRS